LIREEKVLVNEIRTNEDNPMTGNDELHQIQLPPNPAKHGGRFY
jgi:hypothetical protein